MRESRIMVPRPKFLFSALKLLIYFSHASFRLQAIVQNLLGHTRIIDSQIHYKGLCREVPEAWIELPG